MAISGWDRHRSEIGEVFADRPTPVTMAEFWELSRAAWSTSKYLVDRDVQSLEHADLDQLRSVLTQYRWFTSYYSGDLAILIYKLPPSSLRSFFAQCLLEEQGMGDPSQTHPAMYDSFLMSIGVDPDELESSAEARNIELLDSFRRKLLQRDYMYAVGLRGMGAECLCQVYLEAVHHYLLKNEEIQKRRRDIDWRFWDIHASEADQAHGEQTRAFIEQLATSAEKIASLTAGYLDGEQMFMEVWHNAYRALERARQPGGRRVTVDPVPLDGWRYDPAR